MYMSVLDYERKKNHLKSKIFIKNVISCANSRWICASDNISRGNKNPLACYCLLYSNFELLGMTLFS